VKPGSRLTTKQRTVKQQIAAAALCAALLGGVAAPSHAADLGPGYRSHARHVRTARPYWNWVERCAYAGYYCLYAEYGYVFHYPFDDRPVAYSYYRRRHR
jgi:hypothetical protein